MVQAGQPAGAAVAGEEEAHKAVLSVWMEAGTAVAVAVVAVALEPVGLEVRAAEAPLEFF